MIARHLLECRWLDLPAPVCPKQAEASEGRTNHTRQTEKPVAEIQVDVQRTRNSSKIGSSRFKIRGLSMARIGKGVILYKGKEEWMFC